MNRPAEFVLVAGPNGSGKSTVADIYIQERFPDWPKLNADRVAVSLAEEDAEARGSVKLALRAAQIIDAEAGRLVESREPFVLETVLSSDKYCPLVPAVRSVGLIFRLVYITTVDPELNVARVGARVLEGGHDVPAEKIRERWHRSMDTYLPWFAARADRLVVLDNSGEAPKAVALRHLGGVLEMHDHEHPASSRLQSLVGTPVLPPSSA
jgi:predicted ABC-type ATPase